MKEKDLKDAMISIFDSLSASSFEETKNDPLFQFLEKEKEWLGDPEIMNTMINFKFQSIIRECVTKAYNSTDWILLLIYTNYNLFENNVTEITTSLEGASCCADRSRTIIKSYIDYRISGNLPVWKDSYSTPKKGTPQQWMNFIEGVANIFYGKPKKYLLAVKELLKLA